jgi:hypothetical protein
MRAVPKQVLIRIRISGCFFRQNSHPNPLAGILGYPSFKGPAGRVSYQPARCMYLLDRKDTLPVEKVHVPRQLEGFPSSRRGTCTSLAGREPFQPASGILWDTRISAGILGGKGHPHPLAGIRWHWRISATNIQRPSLLNFSVFLLQKHYGWHNWLAIVSGV